MLLTAAVEIIAVRMIPGLVLVRISHQFFLQTYSDRKESGLQPPQHWEKGTSCSSPKRHCQLLSDFWKELVCSRIELAAGCVPGPIGRFGASAPNHVATGSEPGRIPRV